ncbi:contact-dependent growth inhibition system immunity protein [Priestia endophytica]|uniref:contact-dependent growth inhibition system immunity protein n=1 Tax=Priestia endophytica TaxID=135735 RepID=UPI001F5B287D|nr:contact-dependent growth inhibition system immunity protein [Priestia endophytica]
MLEEKMSLLIEEFEELSEFLGGYFHQDMEPLEEVWAEIIENANKKNTTLLLNDIDRFLNSNLSHIEKEEFIKENCDLYFPAINTTPLEWLIQMQIEFKKLLPSLKD